MEELIQKLKEQLIEALNLEEITPDDIDAEAPLFGDGLGLDSIDALEIILIFRIVMDRIFRHFLAEKLIGRTGQGR